MGPTETRVVNRHVEEFDQYIGRGTLFGNPFVIGRDGTRKEVIEKYRIYFEGRVRVDKGFAGAVRRLTGKVLGCSCAPEPCHGDVIIAWLNFQKIFNLDE